MRYVRVLPLFAGLLWQLFFFLAPLGVLLLMSFWSLSDDYKITSQWNTLNYSLLGTKVYSRALMASARLGFEAALLSTALGSLLAYWIVFGLNRHHRAFVAFMLLVPFISSYTIRTLSWQLWLNDSGIVAYALRKVGLLHGSLSLIYTEKATLIGLVSLLLPTCCLIVFLALNRIDTRLLLAARNLGANWLQVLIRVVLPFAMPGILVSLLFAFLIALGDHISVSILGGNQTYTATVLLQDRMKIGDWPGAAAIGVAMLAISLFALWLAALAIRRVGVHA